MTLSDEETQELANLLEDEIGEFGYTRDVTPANWEELELAAVRRVYKKVVDFHNKGVRPDEHERLPR